MTEEFKTGQVYELRNPHSNYPKLRLMTLTAVSRDHVIGLIEGEDTEHIHSKRYFKVIWQKTNC